MKKIIKNYFEPKIYTKKQRLIYGIGWFLISFTVGFILIFLRWPILSFIAFAFGVMSLIAIKIK